MNAHFPSADEYSSGKTRYAALKVVDLRAHQLAIRDAYRNDVLSDVNDDCVRLAVFEGEYRWHCHPDSDELFLVLAGKLEIDLADGDTVALHEWQCLVVPAGVIHRTRAIGRTANITFERRQAKTVFVEPTNG